MQHGARAFYDPRLDRVAAELAAALSDRRSDSRSQGAGREPGSDEPLREQVSQYGVPPLGGDPGARVEVGAMARADGAAEREAAYTARLAAGDVEIPARLSVPLAGVLGVRQPTGHWSDWNGFVALKHKLRRWGIYTTGDAVLAVGSAAVLLVTTKHILLWLFSAAAVAMWR